jgi:hypothetical protein
VLIFQAFVVTAIIQLIARIAKLGWLEDTGQTEILEEVTKFLKVKMKCLQLTSPLSTPQRTASLGFGY